MAHEIKIEKVGYYDARVMLRKHNTPSFYIIGSIRRVAREHYQLSLNQTNAITNANGILGASIDDVASELADRVRNGLSNVR